MRQVLLKTAIFVLTFSLGVGGAISWQLYQWSLVPYEISPTPPWPLGPAKDAVVGKTDKITIVTSMDACGPEANYHTTELSDGTQISQSYETFPSSFAAARALKTILANAEILERSAERDEKGRIMVETILITSPSVMRLTIHGNSLSIIKAPSLKHLHLYESGAFH